MTANENIVELNIGGTVFQTTKSTLTKFDGFFRTILETEIPVTKDKTGAIFVDRDPKNFRWILNFMRDGHVAIPKLERDIQELKTEAQYYLLDGLVELCKTKNSGKCECRFLNGLEELINAYASSTKKGVIVTYHPKSFTIDLPSDIASIAEKFGDDFDVYFSKAEEDRRAVYCRVRRKSDGKVFLTSPKSIDDVIKKNFFE